MKKSVYMFLLIAFLLCACQASPRTSVVVSKNDGAFDKNAAVPASETHAPDATQSAKYTDTFTSTDGSVEYQISIDESLLAVDMPVVEAAPHILTEEDSKRIAESLFGDVPCRESGHVLYPVYSKDEIQDRLNLWGQYVNNDEALENLCRGMNADQIQNIKDILNRAIADYTKRYETAPTQSPYTLTDWKYINSDYRWATEEEIKKYGLRGTFDEISLIIPANGISYQFSSAIRDEAASKLSHVSVMPGRGISPYEIEERIYYAALCRTAPPTQEQITKAEEKAVSMLDKMELGQWCVWKSYVDHPRFYNDNEYVINVDAVPIISGIPAGIMDANTAPQSSAYAFYYYETLAHFEFSADGTIVCFDLTSPIDVIREVNDNVAVMDMDSLIARAKEQLTLSDYRAFGGGSLVDALADKEKIACTVTVNQLDYCLLRVPVKDSPMTFYYAPSISLSGTVEYIGQTSGSVYQSTQRHLLSLNAIDGTVISSLNS